MNPKEFLNEQNTFHIDFANNFLNRVVKRSQKEYYLRLSHS